MTVFQLAPGAAKKGRHMSPGGEYILEGTWLIEMTVALEGSRPWFYHGSLLSVGKKLPHYPLFICLVIVKCKVRWLRIHRRARKGDWTMSNLWPCGCSTLVLYKEVKKRQVQTLCW